MSRRPLLSALVLAGALGPASCAGPRPASPVLLATEPPGVVVSVNGEASGFVTPCMIALSVERPHRIDLELDGYVAETRLIVPGGYEEAVLWTEMDIGHKTWHFPLWLNIDDFFVPVRTKAPLQPWRIHVHMKRSIDDEPAGDQPTDEQPTDEEPMDEERIEQQGIDEEATDAGALDEEPGVD